MYGCIYKITNTINSKIYIGKTTQGIEKRFKTHCYMSTEPRTYTSYLYNAMNCYGMDKFKIEMICECFSEEELNDKETFWIERLDSRNPDIGYNIQEGGEGGATRSKEYKPTIKQLQALEAGRHLPSSQKHKDQLRERRLNCTTSATTREKLRQGSLGRVHMHMGTKNINPKSSEISKYLAKGWELGYYKK